jgi:hypothetical protein
MFNIISVWDFVWCDTIFGFPQPAAHFARYGMSPGATSSPEHYIIFQCMCLFVGRHWALLSYLFIVIFKNFEGVLLFQDRLLFYL